MQSTTWVTHPLFLRARRYAGLLLIALFVSGCALAPSTPGIAPPARTTLDAFSLEGRFSLRHENKNYSGRLSWRHKGPDNTLLLSSPFGQGIAEIITRTDAAQLTTSDGKLYSAADAQTLTRDVLGYPLPLAQLTDWVRARDGVPGVAEHDVQGRPASLRYEDWRIEYTYDSDDAQAPPSRIFAERAGGFELRLKIDEWNSLQP